MRIKHAGKLTLVTILAGLTAALGPPALAQQPDQVKVLIAFHTPPGNAERALVQGSGGRVSRTFHLIPAVSATVPEGAINGLRANPNVRSVDLDGVVYAHAQVEPWGIGRIGATNVHAGGNTGNGVKVGVLDSGIDVDHEDLAGNYHGGYDFVNDDGDPDDDYGHGTHVSGTIAGIDNLVGVIGVAPDADLYGVKVLGSSGSGNWSDVIAGNQWSVDNGMQVTNNSYGSSLNPGGAVQASFDAAAVAGILIVASAGNSGNFRGKGNNVGYPGKYDSVMAVAATDSGDNRASFSSTGSQVEISGPGVGVYSTVPGGYGTANGTSMACPHVAGTAALVIGAGIMDSNAVRAALQSTAEDLGDPGRDSQYGFGLVNADEAVLGGAAPPPPPPPPPGGETTVSVDPVVYTASGGKNRDKHVSVILTVVDDQENAVSGASVSISLSSVDPSGGPWPGTGTTDGAGNVTFTLNNAPSGTYSTTVTGVTGTGLVWDDAQPVDPGHIKL